MTDDEWIAEQPWQRVRRTAGLRIADPPVLDGRAIVCRTYGTRGVVLAQSDGGRRSQIRWSNGGVSWVGTRMVREAEDV